MKDSPINNFLTKGASLLFALALTVALVGVLPVQAAPAADPAPALDQSFTLPGGASTPINGCCRYIAQTFTAGMTGDLAAVSLDVLSTGEYSLHIAIHGVTNGLPNATILGERTLWVSTETPIVSAPLSLIIDGFVPNYVIAGQQYAIVVDYTGSGSPGQARGDWSGASGDAYAVGAAYETNDEGFISWSPAVAPDMDLHFKTYVITGVPVSDLAIRLVSPTKRAKACEVFEETFRIQNLGPDTAQNVMVGVGLTDQFDVVSIGGVPAGEPHPGITLAPGESALVTVAIKVTAFVPQESRDGRVGASVWSEVYPNIAIDLNASNDWVESVVRLISKRVMTCPQ